MRLAVVTITIALLPLGKAVGNALGSNSTDGESAKPKQKSHGESAVFAGRLALVTIMRAQSPLGKAFGHALGTRSF